MSAFFKEMKALQECRHPYVVRYIDRAIESFKSVVYFYIIMEFMSQVVGGVEGGLMYMVIDIEAHPKSN